MIYTSIDIETTGIDPKTDQILEFAAIIENTSNPLELNNIPKFEAIIYHSKICGSPFALNLNSKIIEIIANIPPSYTNAYGDYIKKYNIISPQDLGFKFYDFIVENTDFSISPKSLKPLKILAAGKNFGSFDKQFLYNLPEFTEYITFNHRSINPAEHFTDYVNDVEPPSLNVCLERAGYKNSIVSHKAIDDAWDVIKVLRTQYHKNNEYALNG